MEDGSDDRQNMVSTLTEQHMLEYFNKQSFQKSLTTGKYFFLSKPFSNQAWNFYNSITNNKAGKPQFKNDLHRSSL